MRLAWVTVAIIFAADVVWLPFSRLTVIPSRTFWGEVLTIGVIVLCPVLGAVVHRTRNAQYVLGVDIHLVADRISLFIHAVSFNAALALSLLILTYLGTAAALPLQDANLAAIDHMLGFKWLGFVSAVNARPYVASTIVIAYASGMFELVALFIILSATNRAGRISEACAVLALVSLTVGVIHVFIPAAGAYDFFAPPPEMSSNFGVGAGSWHAHVFAALRETTGSFIDVESPQGLVTFPSMHAVWAVLTWWALRDIRLIGMPTLLWNSIVIVSTIPEGGHYFIDVIAGTAITIGSIVLVRTLFAGGPLEQSRRFDTMPSRAQPEGVL
jgi:membrane-associated phospholipid phosphatase